MLELIFETSSAKKYNAKHADRNCADALHWCSRVKVSRDSDARDELGVTSHYAHHTHTHTHTHVSNIQTRYTTTTYFPPAPSPLSPGPSSSHPSPAPKRAPTPAREPTTSCCCRRSRTTTTHHTGRRDDATRDVASAAAAADDDEQVADIRRPKVERKTGRGGGAFVKSLFFRAFRARLSLSISCSFSWKINVPKILPPYWNP